jgi:hypothetical protein
MLLLCVRKPTRAQELVARYSEFIDHPISLWASHEVEVPDDSADEDTPAEEDIELGAEDETGACLPGAIETGG